LDFAVAALGDQWRQPANFQFQPNKNQQVGISKLEQKARFGLYKVRVLIAFRQRFNIYFVAANFLR
jgi:hypothetical protein